jgi:hypothetical protein
VRTSPAPATDVNEYYVGGSYDFKVVKVMGSAGSNQDDKNPLHVWQPRQHDLDSWRRRSRSAATATSALATRNLDWDMGRNPMARSFV